MKQAVHWRELYWNAPALQRSMLCQRMLCQRMLCRAVLALFCAALVSFANMVEASAQTQASATSDHLSERQLWTSAGVRFDVTKQFRLGVVQHVRFDDDISRVASLMPEARVGYKFTKFFLLSAGYRFIYERDGDGEFEDLHRLHLDARLRAKFKPVRLTYRLRFQDRLEQGKNKLKSRYTLRNRVGVSVDTDSIYTPYLTAELFSRLSGDNAAFARKMRITLGTSFDLDDHDMGVFHRAQFPVGQPGAAIENIVGLEYRFKPL